MSTSTIIRSTDEFQALEQKVLRAVEIVKREREARATAEAEAASLREQLAAYQSNPRAAETQTHHPQQRARRRPPARRKDAPTDGRTPLNLNAKETRWTRPSKPHGPTQSTETQSITVDIYDQVYHLRGTDPAYIERLAAFVDAKMRAVSAHGNTVDSPPRSRPRRPQHRRRALHRPPALRPALAGSLPDSQTTMRSRAGSLAHMLDEVLEDRKAG